MIKPHFNFSRILLAILLTVSPLAQVQSHPADEQPTAHVQFDSCALSEPAVDYKINLNQSAPRVRGTIFELLRRPLLTARHATIMGIVTSILTASVSLHSQSVTIPPAPVSAAETNYGDLHPNPLLPSENRSMSERWVSFFQDDTWTAFFTHPGDQSSQKLLQTTNQRFGETSPPALMVAELVANKSKLNDPEVVKKIEADWDRFNADFLEPNRLYGFLFIGTYEGQRYYASEIISLEKVEQLSTPQNPIIKIIYGRRLDLTDFKNDSPLGFAYEINGNPIKFINLAEARQTVYHWRQIFTEYKKLQVPAVSDVFAKLDQTMTDDTLFDYAVGSARAHEMHDGESTPMPEGSSFEERLGVPKDLWEQMTPEFKRDIRTETAGMLMPIARVHKPYELAAIQIHYMIFNCLVNGKPTDPHTWAGRYILNKLVDRQESDWVTMGDLPGIQKLFIENMTKLQSAPSNADDLLRHKIWPNNKAVIDVALQSNFHYQPDAIPTSITQEPNLPAAHDTAQPLPETMPTVVSPPLGVVQKYLQQALDQHAINNHGELKLQPIQNSGDLLYYQEMVNALVRASFSTSDPKFAQLQNYLRSVKTINLLAGNAESCLSAMGYSPQDISNISAHTALLDILEISTVEDGKPRKEIFLVITPPSTPSNQPAIITPHEVLELFGFWMTRNAVGTPSETYAMWKFLVGNATTNLIINQKDKLGVMNDLKNPAPLNNFISYFPTRSSGERSSLNLPALNQSYASPRPAQLLTVSQTESPNQRSVDTNWDRFIIPDNTQYFPDLHVASSDVNDKENQLETRARQLITDPDHPELGRATPILFADFSKIKKTRAYYQKPDSLDITGVCVTLLDDADHKIKRSVMIFNTTQSQSMTRVSSLDYFLSDRPFFDFAMKHEKYHLEHNISMMRQTLPITLMLEALAQSYQSNPEFNPTTPEGSEALNALIQDYIRSLDQHATPDFKVDYAGLGTKVFFALSAKGELEADKIGMQEFEKIDRGATLPDEVQLMIRNFDIQNTMIYNQEIKAILNSIGVPTNNHIFKAFVDQLLISPPSAAPKLVGFGRHKTVPRLLRAA